MERKEAVSMRRFHSIGIICRIGEREEKREEREKERSISPYLRKGDESRGKHESQQTVVVGEREEEERHAPLVPQRECYRIDPQYLEGYEHVTPEHRKESVLAILSYDALSPATKHLAIEYLDRYLSVQPDKQLAPSRVREYALIVLHLAAKLNEVEAPSVGSLEAHFGCAYTQVEREVLRRLRWNLHPVTHLDQLHSILAAFQRFVDSHRSSFYQYKLQYAIQSKLCSGNRLSASLRQQVLSLLDTLIADAETLAFHATTLCLSTLYLVAALLLGEITAADSKSPSSIYTFPFQSHFLLRQTPFNGYFARFVAAFLVQPAELLPALQFASILYTHRLRDYDVYFSD